MNDCLKTVLCGVAAFFFACTSSPASDRDERPSGGGTPTEAGDPSDGRTSDGGTQTDGGGGSRDGGPVADAGGGSDGDSGVDGGTPTGEPGDAQWLWRSGLEGNDLLLEVATHADGRISVVEERRDSHELWLRQFNAEGNLLWTRKLAVGTSWIDAKGLAMTTEGNLLVTGHFLEQVDFGEGLEGSPDQVSELFVAKFSPDGERLWSKIFSASDPSGPEGDASPIFGMDLVTDETGSAIVLASFYDTADLGGGPLESGTHYAEIDPLPGLLIAKFAWDGSHVWSRSFPGADHALGHALARDAQGRLYVGGFTGREVDFGGGMQVVGPKVPFVLGLDAEGRYRFERLLEGAIGDVRDVAVLEGGRLAFVGDFARSFQFAGEQFVSQGDDGFQDAPSDLFIAVSTLDGADEWGRTFGDNGDDGASEVVGLTGGDLAVQVHGRSLELGGGEREGSVLVRFGPGGVHRWSRDDLCGFGSLQSHVDGDLLVAGSFGGGNVCTHGGETFGAQGLNDGLLMKLHP